MTTSERKKEAHLLIVQRHRFINRQLVNEVRTELDEKCGQHVDRLVLWIQSPGGDAHAAYKLCLELRNRCKRLDAVVLDAAKSAATLLLTGVDNIYMSASAELGPLDVQLQHPDREDVVLSGLDLSKALAALGQEGVSIALRGGASVIRATGLQRPIVIKELMEYSSSILRPVISKLDPQIIHRAIQDLLIADRYARRLLSRRNVDQKFSLSPEECIELADRLVNEYPAHGFVIDRLEAKKMRLPVYFLEEEVQKSLVWKKVRDAVSEAVAGDSDLVCAILDGNIDQDGNDVEEETHERSKPGDPKDNEPEPHSGERSGLRETNSEGDGCDDGAGGVAESGKG